MCGVFGFISKGRRKLNLTTLQRIAVNTMSRGPHAFGFAWIDSKDRLRCFKQTGRITDHLGLLGMASDAKILIGHCRFATQGDPENNLNNHPHSVDGGWLVHNGMIPGYQRIIKRNELAPVTDCDSEVLGLLIETESGSLIERCGKAAIETGTSPLVMLGIWTKPNRMVAVRRGNPLAIGSERGVKYFASLPDCLPGKVTNFRDHSVEEFVSV